MNDGKKVKTAGIIAGVNQETNQFFRCLIYSNYLEPVHTMDRLINKEEDLTKIIEILEERGFSCGSVVKAMDPAEWEIKKEELIQEAKTIAEGKEKEELDLKAAYDAKIAATEKKAKVSKLKLYGVTAVTIAALVGGYMLLSKDAPTTVNAPSVSSPAVTSELNQPLPGNTVDERILAMKDLFAKGELSYDITNPDEVQKRVANLIGYFEKMQKSDITKAEATDFFLLINGIKPSDGVDIDELMRKVQLAAAFDPYFDWREVAGQEIIANKRDSAYADIYFRAINDWKTAAEGHNMQQVSAMGKELVATSYYGMIIKEPLETQVPEIGNVKMENVSSELQAFLTGYVGMTLNYPGYDIVSAIGPITIQGDSINVNHVAEPLAGPHIITPGEQGSTNKEGGEQGLAHSTMIMIVNKYNNGEYPECSEEIKAALNSLTEKAPTKSLK
ncbi:MAG: hypothetical protein PHT75_03550 [Bacilli bacterium]|nr:hypothetical protein [Bacilli bacterium]MDD3305170.1 hypothetical protein [Bacilli bacterium]MDD4053995.1 hypothetical protein [Bacilli bacterium]MDD4411724.1 hypothetical protein [Bacilli bacterium]